MIGAIAAAARAARTPGTSQVRQDYEAARERTRERTAATQAAARGAVAVRDGIVASTPRRRERQSIPGTDVLAFARGWLGRYAAWPSEAALDAVTLWAVHAAARDESRALIWRATPRLLLTSAESGSGKSTVMDLLGIMLDGRGRMPKVTPAKFAEVIGGHQETAFIDEARLMFGAGSASRELQGLLLAGYTRRSTYAVAGKDLSLFGPVCYAGKDDLIALAQPGTSLGDLMTRSIVVEMFRPAELVRELDEDGEAFGEALARALTAWCAQERDALRARAAELGQAGGADLTGDGGRTAQIWRPLFAVADVAGGDWPELARQAHDDLAAGEVARMVDGLRSMMAGWA